MATEEDAARRSNVVLVVDDFALGVLNAAVGRMVTAALWVSPLGILSLIAASILRACDLAGGRGSGSRQARGAAGTGVDQGAQLCTASASYVIRSAAQ